MTKRAFGSRTVAGTTPQVTQIGLGAWPLGQRDGGGGGYGVVDPGVARAVVERYVDLGGTFIDTARGYGTSESVIGSCGFMRSRRESVFIATKSVHTDTLDKLPRIESDLHASLRELKTDYVDLYQIHSPPDDPEVMNRVLDIFHRLKESGTVRMIGASVEGPNVTRATVELARRYVDSGVIDALQLVYSIFRRAHEETFEYAHRHGVAIIVRTVLESGFLTGKYKPGTEFSGHRERWSADRRERMIAEANRLSAAIEPPFESVAQVALRFALERPEVSVVIPGAKSVSQVEANCAVDGLPPLPPRIMEAINAVPDELALLANVS